MRTVFEEEDEAAPADSREARGEEHGQDRELTISSTTLLAIFFGLVLMCGLFFGLGYTLGRRAPSEASQLPSATSPSDLQPSVSPSKPSAASQPAVTAAPADSQPGDAASTADTESPSEPTPAKAPESLAASAPAPTQPVVKPALPVATQSIATPPADSAPTATSIPSAVPAGVMVQIAAISNPADADVLVSALQKRGYTVVARHFSGDPLIHVQVGPFTNRADAIAVRQKLLSDGYNAILK